MITVTDLAGNVGEPIEGVPFELTRLARMKPRVTWSMTTPTTRVFYQMMA
jgi:hypothetical protein